MQESHTKTFEQTVSLGTAQVQTSRTPARSGSFLGYVLAFLFATAAFFSGMQVGASTDHSLMVGGLFTPTPKEGVDMSLFWKVWATLDQRFVATHGTSTPAQTDQERVWSAIEGLVHSYGDPYTVFMPPEDTKMFESDIAGEFGGVGMEVGMRKEVLTVIAPLPDSPAQKAGVLSGDILVKIDDVSTERMSVDEAVRKIRGEKGTTVHLTLFREGSEDLQEITITRDTITIPTLKKEEKNGVFIIHLYNFSATAEGLMQEALQDFAKSSSKKLVIDLRGNPGGYLQSAVGMASYFLPTGKVVVRENFGTDKEENIYRSTGKTFGKKGSFKVVVLVDQGSASASEILAGALQEHGAATLIGTHTFGKGSVQELLDLPGGSSLKVTVARWLTPNGRSISDGGLAPDTEVLITKEDRDAGKDPQLDAAIEFLKK